MCGRLPVRYYLNEMTAPGSTRPSMLPKRPFRTLLAENIGRGYQEYGDDKGKVRLWHLGNRIGIFESSGSISGEHAEFIVAFHKKNIEPFHRPWYTLGNWMDLIGYTPATRRVLTDWQVEMAYDGLHVAHNSKLLAMSLGIANALLKNTVEVVVSEEALDDVLLEIRARHDL